VSDPDLTPTLPHNSVPPPPSQEEDAATVPHSLAPISGASEDQGEGSEESHSAWKQVWRGRWFVTGAAIVAFCAALALGQLSAKRHSVPLPTVSAAASLSTAAPSTVEQVDSPVASVASTDAPLPAAPAVATQSEAIPPPATSDSMQLPPMEVPPASKRGVVNKERGHTQSATPAPHKRFSPSQI
jgi:hypothetical protein